MSRSGKPPDGPTGRETIPCAGLTTQYAGNTTSFKVSVAVAKLNQFILVYNLIRNFSYESAIRAFANDDADDDYDDDVYNNDYVDNDDNDDGGDNGDNGQDDHYKDFDEGDGEVNDDDTNDDDDDMTMIITTTNKMPTVIMSMMAVL